MSSETFTQTEWYHLHQLFRQVAIQYKTQQNIPESAFSNYSDMEGVPPRPNQAKEYHKNATAELQNILSEYTDTDVRSVAEYGKQKISV